MRGGYLQVVRLGRVAIRVHWSVLVGPVVLAGFRFDLAWIASFVAVLLVHELGHARVARSLGLEVHEVAIHALGGHCRHTLGRPLDEQAIAWGGILAQGWLQLAASVVEAALAASPHHESAPVALLHALAALKAVNVPIALLNLLPLAPLDGHLAWRLPKTLFGRTAEPMPVFTPTKPREPNPRPPRDPHFDQALELVKRALDEAKSRRSSSL